MGEWCGDSSGAFGDIRFSSQLEVKSVEMRVVGQMHCTRVPHLLEHIIEGSGLASCFVCRYSSVTVAGIAEPEYFQSSCLDGMNESREKSFDTIFAKSGDERDSTRTIERIDSADEMNESVDVGGRTDFDTDWVVQSADVFDVSMIELTSAIANPEEMCREIVKAIATFASQRLFIWQE
jgi:hypothetical protein